MHSCSKLFSWEEIDVRCEFTRWRSWCTAVQSCSPGKKLMQDMNLLVGVVDAQLFKAVLRRNLRKILILLGSFWNTGSAVKTKAFVFYTVYSIYHKYLKNIVTRETPWQLRRNIIFSKKHWAFSTKFKIFYPKVFSLLFTDWFFWAVFTKKTKISAELTEKTRFYSITLLDF